MCKEIVLLTSITKILLIKKPIKALTLGVEAFSFSLILIIL